MKFHCRGAPRTLGTLVAPDNTRYPGHHARRAGVGLQSKEAKLSAGALASNAKQSRGKNCLGVLVAQARFVCGVLFTFDTNFAAQNIFTHGPLNLPFEASCLRKACNLFRLFFAKHRPPMGGRFHSHHPPGHARYSLTAFQAQQHPKTAAQSTDHWKYMLPKG